MKLPPPLRPPEPLREAEQLVAAARLEEALALLPFAVPEQLSGQAALLAARCLLDRPDPVAALRCAERAAVAGRQVGARVLALRLLGRLRAGLGQHRLAAEAYRALLDLRPDDPEATLLLARALLDHGWPDLARRALAALEVPLQGWWRQVEGWIAGALAGARQEARTLLARREAAQPGDAARLVRCLIRAGRLAAAEAALRRLPDGAEAAWLAACLAERRAWPEPCAIPALDVPADAPAALRGEIAGWLLRGGHAAAAGMAGPGAALDDAGWLLRARLMILGGEAARLEREVAAAFAAEPRRILLARIRMTALALRGDLAPLGAEALPAAPAVPEGVALVQYWDKAVPPADVAEVMASWPQHHPRMRPLRFHRETARAYLLAHYGEQGAAAFDACPHPAVEADLLRYAVLVREGGLWADADDRCRAPWDGVLAAVPPRGLVVSFSDELPFYAFNAPLVARPGNPVLIEALAQAMRALLRRRPGERFQVSPSTGPGLLTRLIAADPASVRLMGQGLLRHLSVGEHGLSYKADRALDWRPD